MARDIRQRLSKALAPINADYAEMVADEMTEIEAHPASFLKHYKIYKVLSYDPSHPTLVYVGFAPRKKAYVLTGSLDNYVKMAKDDGVEITTVKLAAEYVAVALEVTRSMSQLVYVAKSIDDVEFHGYLDADEEEVKNKFIKMYRSRIKAPNARPAGDGYNVTAFVVSNQTVSRHSVIVSKEGDLESEVSPLAEDLPLMIGA